MLPCCPASATKIELSAIEILVFVCSNFCSRALICSSNISAVEVERLSSERAILLATWIPTFDSSPSSCHNVVPAEILCHSSE